MKKLLLTLLILVASIAPALAKEVTFIPEDFGVANAKAIGTQTQGNIQIVFGSGVLYYTSGKSARVYANNEVTFKALNDAKLEKITFTYSQGGYTAKSFTSSIAGAYTNPTWTANGEDVTSFTVKNLEGAQVRISKIVVTYSEPSFEATKIDVSPAPVDGKLEIEKGQSITFTADAGENLSVGGEMVENPYTITPTEEGELTAYAVFEGAVLENVSATVAWTFKAAAPVGDFVFTPADEEVLKGTEVNFTAENAVESSYAYMIEYENGESTEWISGNKFTVNEACYVTVKAANVDGVEKTHDVAYTIVAAPAVGAFVFSVDAENGEVEVIKGTEISFTAPNAVESSYAYRFDDGEWIAGNKFTVTKECMVEVKAANVDGEEKTVVRMYTIAAAPKVGDFVFSVDEEGGVVAVLPGTKISFTAPNAVEDTYAYSFDYENWISGNEFTVTEACTVYVKAANVDGVENEDIREYTIREAEIYTRITSAAQLKEGVKYVLIAEKNNKFYGMKTYTSGNYANSNEVTVSADKYVFDAANGLQVFTLEKVGGDWAINLGENYLAASGTGTPNFATSTSATALTITENSSYGFIVYSGTYPVLYNVSSPRFKFYAGSNIGNTSYGTAVLYGLVDDSVLEATTIAVTPAPDAENNIALWAGETVTVAADYGDYILVNDEKVANPYTFTPAAGEYTVYALNNTEDVKGISTTFTVSVKEHVLYSKVTSTAAITAEGKYVLVNEAFNSVASAYTQGDRITGTDVTLNSGTYYQTEDVLVFSFEKGENGYYLVLDNGLYLQAATDRPNFVEKSAATEFTVSFNNGNVVIANGTRSLMRNSTATNNIFRFYTSGSPIALYAATEAVEIPEHLYCHGTFTRGNWILSEPIEFEKNGDKFSFNPVMLGELNGEAHFFFSDSKTEVAAATLATAAQSDINWAELTDNAVIYAPSAGEHTAVQGGDLHTMTAHVAGTFGNTQPHSFVAQAYKPLAMEVDFSTGVPVVTLADTDQTGVNGIEADEANAEVEFYNLQGIRVENPAAGLYIRRQGNSTAKVYIR